MKLFKRIIKYAFQEAKEAAYLSTSPEVREEVKKAVRVTVLSHLSVAPWVIRKHSVPEGKGHEGKNH